MKRVRDLEYAVYVLPRDCSKFDQKFGIDIDNQYWCLPCSTTKTLLGDKKKHACRILVQTTFLLNTTTTVLSVL